MIMRKILRCMGIAGFLVCLILMYTTDIGERGLRKYDADFQLLDMRFHYAADDVGEAFADLGEDGIAVYQRFWILDFAFIACFLIVMLGITYKFVHCGRLRSILTACILARAVFDIAENSLLLYLSDAYPVCDALLATIGSWATTSKFIALYLWMAGIAAAWLYPVIKRKMNHENRQL